jgi:hypothetical protein
MKATPPPTAGAAGVSAGGAAGVGAVAAEHGWRGAFAYCRRREHLRRTVRIALIVGIVLTSINQLDVILRGDATAVTWLKCGMNFVVPFIVSNLGLLSGRRS